LHWAENLGPEALPSLAELGLGRRPQDGSERQHLEDVPESASGACSPGAGRGRTSRTPRASSGFWGWITHQHSRHVHVDLALRPRIGALQGAVVGDKDLVVAGLPAAGGVVRVCLGRRLHHRGQAGTWAQEPRPGRAALLAIGRLEHPAGMRLPRHGPGLAQSALHEFWSRSAAQNSARPALRRCVRVGQLLDGEAGLGDDLAPTAVPPVPPALPVPEHY
jgi:hypothetical protein